MLCDFIAVGYDVLLLLIYVYESKQDNSNLPTTYSKFPSIYEEWSQRSI